MLFQSKKLLVFVLTVVLLVSTAGVALALDTTSLRLQSMSPLLRNIMSDEYTDFQVFSTALLDVDGFRLYTEHGNLLGMKRRPDGGDSTNVIGLAGEIMGFKLAAFFEQERSSSVFSQFVENPNWETEYKEDAMTSSLAGRILLATSLTDTWDVGAHLGLSRTSNDDGQQNTSGEDYEYNQQESWKNMSYTLGANARGAIGPGMLSIGLEVAPTTQTTENTSLTTSSYDDGRFIEQSIDNNKWSYARFTAKAMYELPLSVLDKPMTLRASGAYSFAGDDSPEVEESDSWDDRWSIDKTDYAWTESRIHDNSGSWKYHGYEVAIGPEIQLNESTVLAMGLKITGSNSENVTKSDGQKYVGTWTVKEEGVVDKDISDIYSDITKQKYTYTNSRSVFAVAVPFGLETKIGKSFTLRLGATSTFYNTVTTKNSEEIEEGVLKKKWELLNGDVVDEPDETLPGDTWSNEETNVNTQTTLSFGFGYAINDNISLDLMTSGDFTNLNNARISLNIRF